MRHSNQINYLFVIIIGMVLSVLVQKKLKNKFIYVLIIGAVLRIILDNSVYSFSFLTGFIVLFLVFMLIYSFINGYVIKIGRDIFSKETPTSDLKSGMILSEVIVKKGRLMKKEFEELKKEKDIEIIKYKGEYYIKKSKEIINKENLIDEESEGISEEYINFLKEIGIKKIKTSQTIPFAPLIFLGVLITLISNGNFLMFIKMLLIRQ